MARQYTIYSLLIVTTVIGLSFSLAVPFLFRKNRYAVAVVFKSDIKSGELISASKVDLLEFPRDLIPQGVANCEAEVVGKTSMVSCRSGAFAFHEDLGMSPYSKRLFNRNMRISTVRVSASTKLWSELECGDRVTIRLGKEFELKNLAIFCTSMSDHTVSLASTPKAAMRILEIQDEYSSRQEDCVWEIEKKEKLKGDTQTSKATR